MLEQLEPHTNLKKLSIKFYCGTRFPHWLGKSSFSNMVSLRLSDCMNCVDLPPLWQLPSLQVLIIESMDAVTGWVLNSVEWISHFSLWRLLTFEEMSEWEEWVSSEVGGGEFPCLRELCIRRCPKLKGNLPKQLPSIVKVEIFECQELDYTYDRGIITQGF